MLLVAQYGGQAALCVRPSLVDGDDDVYGGGRWSGVRAAWDRLYVTFCRGGRHCEEGRIDGF
jgi:hypothetical protein